MFDVDSSISKIENIKDWTSGYDLYVYGNDGSKFTQTKMYDNKKICELHFETNGLLCHKLNTKCSLDFAIVDLRT